MSGTFKEAARVTNAAHMVEIISASEAGDEGHMVRNILWTAAGDGDGRGRAAQSPWRQAGDRLPHLGHHWKPGREAWDVKQ